MTRSLDIETPLGPKVFILTEFSGSEHLGRLSEFRIQLKCKRPDITGEQMLGQNVTIRVELAVGSPPARYFNGYITQWTGVDEIVDSTEGAKQTKAYLYSATVHPWLWFLTRQANSRIFQEHTVPEIIKLVFDAHGGLADASVELQKSNYRKWNYCCQYRETDFNFISRLMEQEGIYYYFRHDNGKHTLVLADTSAQHKPVPHYEQLKYDQEDSDSGEVVGQWNGRYEIQTGKYVTDDFNPVKPRTQLISSAEQARSHPYAGFEFYDYPGEFEDPDVGRQVAGTRLEEIQAQYHTFAGGGSVRGFQPGHAFDLVRHPVDAYNTKYLIVGATYSSVGGADSTGSAASGFVFTSQIVAVLFTQPYRSPRGTPKPLIQGPQTATVVGPSGEEIYTDDKEHLGCVKVQFRWDRYGTADQNSSCWIRVATPWAGNGYGAMVIPRLGQEVVVEFLEGDPDRPIITGSVYNGVNKPPYKLPDEKTRWGLKSRSSKGGGASNFNELRFEDKKGSEEIYIHAEKDHNLYIKNDRNETIGNESNLDVTKDSVSKYRADVHTEITGDDIAKVDGDVHLKVGMNWETKAGMKYALEAGQEIHLKAGMKLVLESGVQITLKVGGNFIDIGPAGIFIKGSMVFVNSGGSAGSGSGASPKTPKTAKKAADSVGGTDAPITQKAAALIAARAASTPFCEICNA